MSGAHCCQVLPLDHLHSTPSPARPGSTNRPAEVGWCVQVSANAALLLCWGGACACECSDRIGSAWRLCLCVLADKRCAVKQGLEAARGAQRN